MIEWGLNLCPRDDAISPFEQLYVRPLILPLFPQEAATPAPLQDDPFLLITDQLRFLQSNLNLPPDYMTMPNPNNVGQ